MGNRNETNLSNKLTFLVVGGGIGAILALLFAPKAGTDLRQDIAVAARNGAEQTRETAQLVKEQATAYYGTARDKVGEVYQTVAQKAQEFPEKARQAVAGQTAPINAALEAGKDAYQENAHATM